MESRQHMAVVFTAVLTRLHRLAHLDDPGPIVYVGYLRGRRQLSVLCTAVQRTWEGGKEGGHRRTVMVGALCAGQEPEEVRVRVGALKRQQGTRCPAVPSRCQVWRSRMSGATRRRMAALRDQADPILRRALAPLVCQPEISWPLLCSMSLGKSVSVTLKKASRMPPMQVVSRRRKIS